VRVGITGHRDLTPRTIELVTRAFEELLPGYPDLIGVTALAEGADQLFARAVLAQGGTLEVLVPSAEYRSLREDVGEYDTLLAAAARVTRLPFDSDGPNAHMAAGLVVIERSDLVLAVWDGQPARAFAGTADFVRYARQEGVPVTVVWPPGAARAA
jgi:hypothetical protein